MRRFLKNSLLLIAGIFFWVITLFPSFSSPASLSVPLDDWKYEAIDRIALAWGIKYPINSRPMNRLEMAEIVRNVLEIKKSQNKKRGDYLERLLQRLKEDLADMIEELNRGERKKGIQSFKSITLETAYGDGSVMKENNFGDMLGKGWHGRIIPELGLKMGILAVDVSPRLSLDSNEEYDNKEADFQRAYLKLEGNLVGIEFGKDPLWWGPGKNGAWVMTNNAQPFELIRFYNPRPYSIKFLGKFKFNMIYGRPSEQVIKYEDNDIDKTKTERPHFGGMRLNLAPSRYLELGASITAFFTGRDGLTASDIQEVFFPRHRAVDREETEGPITDRIASYDLAVNIPSPFEGIEGMKLYMEYGGTDLSFVDRVFPRLTDAATLYGLYLDSGTTDIRMEYAQNLESNDTIWYTHSQFTSGYTNKGDIIGYHIGGTARDFWIRMTHPLDERWKVSFDYEYLLNKDRPGNMPGRKNEISIGLDYFGDNDHVKIEYEYEDREYQGMSKDNLFIMLSWKRFY